MVKCPVNCSQPFEVHDAKTTVKLTCLGCNMYCHYPKPVVPRSAPTTWLADVGVVKTGYPREFAVLEWRKAKDRKKRQLPVPELRGESEHSLSPAPSVAPDPSDAGGHPSPSPVPSIAPPSPDDIESGMEAIDIDLVLRDLVDDVATVPLHKPDATHLAPPRIEKRSTSLPKEDLRSRVATMGKIRMPPGIQVRSLSAPEMEREERLETSSSSRKRETPSRPSGSRSKKRKEA